MINSIVSDWRHISKASNNKNASISKNASNSMNTNNTRDATIAGRSSNNKNIINI